MQSGLLTDLCQLNMIEAYLDHQQTNTAVFELFFRKFPLQRGFLMAAGVEQALDFLEEMRFSDADIDWLRGSGRFTPRLLEYLREFRFTGDVDAMPEATIFSIAGSAICRDPTAQHLAFPVPDRIQGRAHRLERAGQAARRFRPASRSRRGGRAFAARASYIAGFAGTATMLAERVYGIPLYGTMAHSFIEIHDTERVAFENFAQSRPQHLTFLIDTYEYRERRP